MNFLRYKNMLINTDRIIGIVKHKNKLYLLTPNNNWVLPEKKTTFSFKTEEECYRCFDNLNKNLLIQQTATESKTLLSEIISEIKSDIESEKS